MKTPKRNFNKPPQGIQPVQPNQMVIKEIMDGIGKTKDMDRSLSTFQRTTRNYEDKRHMQPNSPGPDKFSPKYSLVHQNSPQPFQETQRRFANDLDVKKQTMLKLGNPRFDEFEGEYTLFGKQPDCSTCNTRRQKVEKEWLIKPMMHSMYAKICSPSLRGAQQGSNVRIARNSTMENKSDQAQSQENSQDRQVEDAVAAGSKSPQSPGSGKKSPKKKKAFGLDLSKLIEQTQSHESVGSPHKKMSPRRIKEQGSPFQSRNYGSINIQEEGSFMMEKSRNSLLGET